MSSPVATATRLPGANATALRILARSLVRELDRRGYGLQHIVALATELIDLASESIRSKHVPQPGDQS